MGGPSAPPAAPASGAGAALLRGPAGSRSRPPAPPAARHRKSLTRRGLENPSCLHQGHGTRRHGGGARRLRWRIGLRVTGRWRRRRSAVGHRHPHDLGLGPGGGGLQEDRRRLQGGPGRRDQDLRSCPTTRSAPWSTAASRPTRRPTCSGCPTSTSAATRPAAPSPTSPATWTRPSARPSSPPSGRPCRPTGSRSGCPHHTDTSALAYNKSHFKKAGITDVPQSLDEAWTWEDFVEVLQKLKAANPGAAPFAFNYQLYGAYRWFNTLYQAGGTVLDDSLQNVTLDTPQARKALEWTKSLYTNGLHAPSVLVKRPTYPDEIFPTQ